MQNKSSHTKNPSSKVVVPMLLNGHKYCRYYFLLSSTLQPQNKADKIDGTTRKVLCHLGLPISKKNFTFSRLSHISYHAEFIPIDIKRKVPNPAGAKLSSVRLNEVGFDLVSSVQEVRLG